MGCCASGQVMAMAMGVDTAHTRADPAGMARALAALAHPVASHKAAVPGTQVSTRTVMKVHLVELGKTTTTSNSQTVTVLPSLAPDGVLHQCRVRMVSSTPTIVGSKETVHDLVVNPDEKATAHPTDTRTTVSHRDRRRTFVVAGTSIECYLVVVTAKITQVFGSAASPSAMTMVTTSVSHAWRPVPTAADESKEESPAENENNVFSVSLSSTSTANNAGAGLGIGGVNQDTLAMDCSISIPGTLSYAELPPEAREKTSSFADMLKDVRIHKTVGFTTTHEFTKLVRGEAKVDEAQAASDAAAAALTAILDTVRYDDLAELIARATSSDDPLAPGEGGVSCVRTMYATPDVPMGALYNSSTTTTASVNPSTGSPSTSRTHSETWLAEYTHSALEAAALGAGGSKSSAAVVPL